MSRLGNPRILGAVIAGAAALALAAPAHAEGEVVTYTVTSDGPLTEVVYFDSAGEVQRITSGLKPSWSTTFASTEMPRFNIVSAGTTGQSLSCKVEVNGKVVDQQQASGPSAEVECSDPNPEAG